MSDTNIVGGNKRHRSYCFTMHVGKVEELPESVYYKQNINGTEIQYNLLLDKWCEFVNLNLEKIKDKIVYVIGGFEMGDETKRWHVQGYIQFKNPQLFKTVIRMLDGCHVIVARGTKKQNIDYCSKSGDIFEWGNNDTQGYRNDLTKIKEDILVNNKPINEVAMMCENFQQIRFAEVLNKYVEPSYEFYEKEVKWFWGKTGLGKTKAASEEYNYHDLWKCSNDLKWFDGYYGQKNVIFEDFRGNMCPYSWLLRLLDGYEERVPTKGSFVIFKPKSITITSPYHPEDVYQNIEDKGQLLRRITEIRSFGDAKRLDSKTLLNVEY